MKVKDLTELALNAVIRPPRKHYKLESFPMFLYISDEGENNSMKIIRNPVNICNRRQEKIIGSIYTIDSSEKNFINSEMPCVIYLHGNASTQQEGTFLIPNLCQYGIAVFLFDFAGCGESEGEYISLGLYEAEDVALLIEQLVTLFNLGPFILWGRSMGASTSLMTELKNIENEKYRIVGMIIDSTFSRLEYVCKSIGIKNNISQVFAPLAIWFLNLKVKSNAGFSIYDVNPIEYAKNKDKPPAIFGHSPDDELIPYEQALDVFNAYSNDDKVLIELEGGHDDERQNMWYDTCFKFILEKLAPYYNCHDEDPVFDFRYRIIKSEKKHSHFKSFQELVDFSNEHGGKDKSVTVIPIESDIICYFADAV